MSTNTSRSSPGKQTNAQQGQSANTSHTAPSKETNAKQGQYEPCTDYKQVKDGWGSRTNFQASYGLGMDPDGIEEGNAILQQFEEFDRQNWEAEHGGKSEK